MSVSLGGSADAMDVAPTLAAARKSADIKPYWRQATPIDAVHHTASPATFCALSAARLTLSAATDFFAQYIHRDAFAGGASATPFRAPPVSGSAYTLAVSAAASIDSCPRRFLAWPAAGRSLLALASSGRIRRQPLYEDFRIAPYVLGDERTFSV